MDKSKQREKQMKLTKIILDEKNRMLIVGLGKNAGNWFFRVDLWYMGIRLS